MLNYIIAITGILFSSLTSYFSTKVLVRYIYLYAESFYRKPLLFVLFYAGLINSITIYISSINLTLHNNGLLGYHLLIYNAVLDVSIVLGILILFKKLDRIDISKNYVFIASLSFTIHLFLILKKKLDLIDTIISFVSFIALSIILIKEEREINLLKRKEIDTSILFFIPVIVVSVALIIASSFLISAFAIYLNNILNNVPLAAYAINLINTLSQNLIFVLAIIENREKAEEGLLPVLGEIIFTFTIYTATVSGITTIVFSIESLLSIISSIFLMYMSLLLLNLLSRDIVLPREAGIILLLLAFMIGLLTMV